MMMSCHPTNTCLASFQSDVKLPDRAKALATVSNGEAGRDLITAVFDGDIPAVERLLTRDPRLKTTGSEGDTDLLTIAISKCNKPLVQKLLTLGVSPSGLPGATSPPLMMAVESTDPWYAQILLAAGASPNPATPDGESAMAELIASHSVGGVKLLLDHGFAVNSEDNVGERALQTALDMGEFSIAEVLLDHGADPWAVNHLGATLGWSVTQPPLSQHDDDLPAYARLQARVRKLGWPDPAPSPVEVRALIKAGHWPPRR